MYKTICIFLFFICGIFAVFVSAEDISVQLSKKKIGITDSLSITFSSSQPIKEPPDFSPLQTDFVVLSNSHNQSISIINGQITREVCWKVVVMPKREGELVIPAIRFGEYNSSPQTIEVTHATEVKQDDDIFLELELSPKESVYEQSLLTYTVRLYCSLSLSQAALSDISVNDKDAIIDRIGNDIEYDHNHKNGKHYRVYERKYAIFPQHAGELIFSPLVFEGAVISGGNSFFDLHTRIKRVHSDSQKIEVKPIPAPFNKNNWLAANAVSLTEEWSTPPEKVALGEPVTWTLKLTADGCLGTHIPDIAMEFPTDLKNYLDKPETSNQSTSEGLQGIKQIKVALIPTKPGEILLPKIVVPWWDLKTDQIRYTELPARKINVLENHIAMNDLPKQVAGQPTAAVKEEITTEINHRQSMINWYIAGGVTLLIVGVCFFGYRQNRNTKSDCISLTQVKNDLKKACQAGNAKQAEACLLAWALQIYPNCKPLNIIGIKAFLSKEMQEAVDGLYQALYGKKTAWKGDALWQAFRAFKPKVPTLASAAEKKLLKELYP